MKHKATKKKIFHEISGRLSRGILGSGKSKIISKNVAAAMIFLFSICHLLKIHVK